MDELSPQDNQHRSFAYPTNGSKSVDKILLIIGGALVCFVLLVAIIVIKKHGKAPTTITYPKPALTPSPGSKPQDKLPIALHDPSVAAALVNYTLTGKIDQVQNRNSTYHLTLRSLPVDFGLDPKVTMTKVRQGKAEPIQPSALASGQNVLVSATYDSVSGLWRVITITVLEQSATPSGTRQ